jgi:hypothetical protein
MEESVSLKTIIHRPTEQHTPNYHNLELYIQVAPRLLLINLRILHVNIV